MDKERKGIQLTIEDFDKFEEKPIDYSSFAQMDDITLDGKSAIVISNDTDNRKIIVEYDSSGEMESIKYENGGSIKSLETKLNSKYKDLKTLFLSENKDVISIDMIEIDSVERKKGLGSSVIEEIIDYADENQKEITLVPALPNDRKGTTSRSRLVKFYKRFGFVENKGRNKDFTKKGGSMYRLPKSRKGGSIKSKGWFIGELAFLNW